MTTAKDIMSSKIVTVPVGTPLINAYGLMKEKRIRHLPVLDEGEEIVGILSMRDFQFGLDLSKLKVEHLMVVPVAHVFQDTSLKEAILLMLSKKISSLLVLDENDYAVGIMTTDDILLQLANQLKDERSPVAEFLADSAQTVGRVLHTIAQTGI
jgi:acetoin utilization protein AcuB